MNSSSRLLEDESSIRTQMDATAPPQLSLRFDWTLLGGVTLDSHGRLTFPKIVSLPGLYRLSMVQNGLNSLYTGQTDNLARRFQHYRTPGSSQQTNIRLNQLMIDTLESNGEVLASVITSGATVEIGDVVRPVDLASKSERILLEHAAISIAYDTGVETLNR